MSACKFNRFFPCSSIKIIDDDNFGFLTLSVSRNFRSFPKPSKVKLLYQLFNPAFHLKKLHALAIRFTTFTKPPFTHNIQAHRQHIPSKSFPTAIQKSDDTSHEPPERARKQPIPPRTQLACSLITISSNRDTSAQLSRPHLHVYSLIESYKLIFNEEIKEEDA